MYVLLDAYSVHYGGMDNEDVHFVPDFRRCAITLNAQILRILVATLKLTYVFIAHHLSYI